MSAKTSPTVRCFDPTGIKCVRYSEPTAEDLERDLVLKDLGKSEPLRIRVIATHGIEHDHRSVTDIGAVSDQ